mmetsp:Transcript_53526/g.116954  ORF Transcript_53526/g.116954 Transcript_53526/m.116954 type:complete len:214 (+) Transcript_53526:833-1474(+)
MVAIGACRGISSEMKSWIKGAMSLTLRTCSLVVAPPDPRNTKAHVWPRSKAKLEPSTSTIACASAEAKLKNSSQTWAIRKTGIKSLAFAAKLLDEGPTTKMRGPSELHQRFSSEASLCRWNSGKLLSIKFMRALPPPALSSCRAMRSENIQCSTDIPRAYLKTTGRRTGLKGSKDLSSALETSSRPKCACSPYVCATSSHPVAKDLQLPSLGS